MRVWRGGGFYSCYEYVQHSILTSHSNQLEFVRCVYVYTELERRIESIYKTGNPLPSI